MVRHRSDPVLGQARCALAIALGTYLGGWRIIRTLGKGLVEISSPQGMAAESSSAAVILASSHLGFALSTTHVATGSILGTGVGKKGAEVRWGVAGRMVLAWLITFPMAAVGGRGHVVDRQPRGGLAGAIVVFAILVGLSALMYVRSRRAPSTTTTSTTTGTGLRRCRPRRPPRPSADEETLDEQPRLRPRRRLAGAPRRTGPRCRSPGGLRRRHPVTGVGHRRLRPRSRAAARTRSGRVLAALCFAVVLAGVALGITFIVASGFGYALSFEHVYPTLVEK